MPGNALRRLRGQLRVRVECPFPERILNLCGEKRLSFWDLRWESAGVFTFRLSPPNFRRLRHASEQMDCECVWEILERDGIPAFFARLVRRPGLVISLTICATALFLGSFFIWDYEVTGNKTVPTERILRALEKEGMGLGTFGLALDGEDLRNRVLLDLPELVWISVNVSGCKAKVDVRERILPPEILDEATPANVVARRDGLVLRVSALDGVAAVLPGTTVTEGQLLISGVDYLETTGKARMIAGHGSVTARTWHTLTTSLSLHTVEKRYTGQESSAFSLIFGKRRGKLVPFSRLTAPEEGTGYEKQTRRTPLSLFGLPLPVTLVREQYRFYEEVPVTLSVAEGQRRGEAALRSQLEAETALYGEIRSALCSSRQRGDTLEVALLAECVEEIGVTVPAFGACFSENAVLE